MNNTISSQPEEYPDDKNPFGDEESADDSPEEVSKLSTDKTQNQLKSSLNRRPSDALNPFCDEEDIDDNDINITPKPKPRQSLNVSTPSSAVPSPTSSIRSGRKKRPAPTPPTCSTPNIPTSLSNSFVANSSDNSRRDSIISSVSSDLGSLSLQNSRTPTPLPRHRRQKSMEELSNTVDNTNKTVGDITVNSKDNVAENTTKSAENIADNVTDIKTNSKKNTTNETEDNTTDETVNASNNKTDSTDNTTNDIENNKKIIDKTNESIDPNLSLRTTDSDSEQKKSSTSDLRMKKRPAPPIPVVKRIVKGSLADIETELNSIGDQLPEIEKKNKELEQLLMKRLEDKDNNSNTTESSAGPEGQQQKTVDKKNDSLMDEFLFTARERCRLGRRQKELMYMKREHKLEEIQMDIEYQMRCVISKQAAQKTKEDVLKEEELLKRLVEIIEERNDIVENMIRDENKEVEEYQKLISKVTPPTTEPNGALKEDKQTKHKTNDKNFVKFKEKLKLKETKEKKKSKKLPKTSEKSDISPENRSEPSVKPSEIPKPKSNSNSGKHLTLKSTLKPFRKSLGLKSTDLKKSDKNSPVVVVTDDNNCSNASKSDK